MGIKYSKIIQYSAHFWVPKQTNFLVRFVMIMNEVQFFSLDFDQIVLIRITVYLPLLQTEY